MSAPYNKSGWKGPLEASRAKLTFSPAPKLDQVAQNPVCSSTNYLQGGGSLSGHQLQCLTTVILKSFSLLSDNRCQLDD